MLKIVQGVNKLEKKHSSCLLKKKYKENNFFFIQIKIVLILVIHSLPSANLSHFLAQYHTFSYHFTNYHICCVKTLCKNLATKTRKKKREWNRSSLTEALNDTISSYTRLLTTLNMTIGLSKGHNNQQNSCILFKYIRVN